MAADGNSPYGLVADNALDLALNATGPRVFACDSLWQLPEPLLLVMKHMFGKRRLDSFGGSYGWSVRYRQVEDYEALNMSTLAEYIDAFREGDIKLPYLRHLSVNKAMPDLHEFINEPDEFKPNWAKHPFLDRLSGPEIFIGQAGTTFGNLHQDQVGVHVGFVQLQGSKEFVLIPPEDGKHLELMEGRQFPFEMRNSAIHYQDLTNTQKHPGLKHVRMQRITLHEGQALFMPCDWWHTTHNLTDSVSYSTRIVNASNAATVFKRHLEGIPRWLKRKLR